MRPMAMLIVLLSVSLAALVASAGDRSPAHGADRLPPGQARHHIWQSFFEGCTEGHTDNEYLCACAATYSLDKCQREGARTDAAIAACLQNQINVQEAARQCTAYGELTTGGRVPAVTPMSPGPEPAHLQRTTRLSRWTGSFQGCMRSATPAERARAPSIQYTCACMATYIVNACAPHDQVSNSHVQRCVDVIGMQELNRVSVLCDGYGSLRMR